MRLEAHATQVSITTWKVRACWPRAQTSGLTEPLVHPRPGPRHQGQQAVCSPSETRCSESPARPGPATIAHFMEACALFMTTRRFCKPTSVFCFTTVRLAPWPERRASFSRLKLETCACGGVSSY